MRCRAGGAGTGVLLVALAIAIAAAPAAANPRQELVEAYAPITMLRAQEDPPCDVDEEQYLPTSVDVVLGTPDVELVRVAEDGETEKPITDAPTAANLAGRGERFHLNLPGDPLEPECTYAEDFAAIVKAGDAPTITYAHYATERGHRGFVIQYWFYYYFNQFNDLHESDWEGMQIAFDAATPREALETGPDEIVLFQHAGGEKAKWDDPKLDKEGTHPIVHPAAGSHATFYESAVFVENGQRGSGLGCDNTTEPLRRVALRPVLVPDSPTVGGRLQWLTYKGRWGQKEAS